MSKIKSIDEHEWEYYEEARQDYLRSESEQRFKSMPKICQHCRWFDWYYFEECQYRLYPQNGRCSKHCPDYQFVYSLPSRKLAYLFWNVQYRIWKFRQIFLEQLRGD